MPRVEVNLPGQAYTVHVGPGLLADPSLWQDCLGTGRVVVVSDQTVAPLYLDTVLQAIGRDDADSIVIPDGEASKTAQSWMSIIDELASMRARRDATLVALGGGVIGDLAGFAAASWMRGINVVQAPTTLLAQVDAAIGGKTGFNHRRGKNLVGAFHQPVCVIADTDTLKTLDEREYRAGLAEVVKYGAIRDCQFLDWLEANVAGINRIEINTVSAMVERAARHKAEVVVADEKEQGQRMLLNFGHTFGHALETVTGYRRFLHGEAVGLGMLMAASLSENTGHSPAGVCKRLTALLEAFGLPVRLTDEIAVQDLTEAMTLDKKALAGGLRLVLLADAGEAFSTDNIDEAALQAAIASLQPNE